MIPLTDSQLERVEQTLKLAGLTYAPLREELFDHLCTAIECAVADGTPFEIAMETTLSEFGEAGLKGVEQQTLQLLTYKSTLMKRISLAASVLTLTFVMIALSGFSQQIPSLSPLIGDLQVTSSFGMKNHPAPDNKKIMHKGIDLRAATGTEVRSTADGVIVHAGENPDKKGYGIYIMIQHGEEYHTLYAHLSKVVVKAGDEIKRGELIGNSGNTGFSKGPHLHYEVVKNGEKVDPAGYFER